MADKKLSVTTPLSELTGTEEFYVIINEGSEETPVWVEKRVALADVLTFELSFCVLGYTADAEQVFRHIAAVPFWLPVALTGSVFHARVAAFAETVYTIKKNAVSIGTLTFAASANTPTIAFTTKTYFSVGDILTVDGPTTADGSIEDIAFNLLARRAEP
jgi:hypothetical protein